MDNTELYIRAQRIAVIAMGEPSRPKKNPSEPKNKAEEDPLACECLTQAIVDLATECLAVAPQTAPDLALREAARDLITSWDYPATNHSGDAIMRLRKALATPAQPDPRDPEYLLEQEQRAMELAVAELAERDALIAELVEALDTSRQKVFLPDDRAATEEEIKAFLKQQQAWQKLVARARALTNKGQG